MLSGQMVVVIFGVITKLTGRLLPETELMILFEEALDGFAHKLLDVTMQRTLSLFAATAE